MVSRSARRSANVRPVTSMRAAANATAARNRNLHRRDSPRLRAQRGRPTRCDDGAGSGFARLLHQAFTIGTPFQGFSKWPSIIPGRCPGLWLNRPFGAGKSGASCRSPDAVIPRKRCASRRSPKGAIQPQPRATPWYYGRPFGKALKGRPNGGGWCGCFHFTPSSQRVGRPR